MTPLQQAAWNKAIRDSVDALLHKGGYNEESSARHQLAMMNFDVESEQAQLVEPIGYVRHADKTFWPHPECAVYASVSPSLAPVYAHPAPPPAKAQHDLPLELLERLSKTLTNLGYSTPEGGMEHFGARIESQLYNLCRGVDSILAQQVAVPMTNGEIYTAYITAASQTLRPQDERIALAFARAIEAFHGIGDKP